MTKKVISVLALCLVLVWSVAAFGSSTPKYTAGKNRVQDLVPWSGSEASEANAISGGRTFGQPYSVGVSASPGTAVGNTYYDYQHNGSSGRQVGQYNGKIKMSWMDQDFPQISPGRKVKWNIVSVVGSPVSVGLDNGGSVVRLPVAAPGTFDTKAEMVQDQAGYTNMIVRNNGKSVVFYHAVGAWASWGAAVDGSADNGIFTSSPAPQYGGFADTAIWPHGCYQQDGTDTLLHVVAIQSANAALTDQRLYYWRGHINGINITWEPAVLIDSVSVNSPVVEASRVDRKVAIVYTKPREIGTQVNNDVVYRLSTNAGESGLTTGYFNVTNYVDASTERAYTDCAAVFDNDGDLHILWNTLYNDPVDGLAWMPVNLNHWDATNGIRTITTADWQNTCDQIFGGFRGGVFNLQIAKPQIVVKPVGSGSGAAVDSEYIYAIWTQFGPDTLDCATQADGTTLGGQVNGELWCSVSSDNGNTWDRPQNITGTRTPDCTPGNCHSEHWSSAAPVADSGIYLTYVDDTHAGGVVRDTPQEGTWTNSPYMAYAIFTRDPVSEPRIAVGPKLNYVELNVPPDGNDSLVVTINNVGNSALSYTLTVASDNGGQSHVVVNGGGSYSNTIPAAGAPQNVTVTYDGLGLGNPDPDELNWRVEVTSNDATNDPNQGGAAIDVNLNVFVASPWYTCVNDTISTGQHRLAVGSCLELGDAGSGGGLFSYADSSEYIFDMSPVVAWNNGAQNLVYRDILLNSLAERSRDSNKAFRAQSAVSVSRGVSSDVATGKAYTTDSIISLDYEVTTYKDPGAQKGFVAKYTITNVTGTTYNGVHFGVAADLDIDSMSSANDGIADPTIQYIGARGGYRDESGATTAQNKYAAVFYIPLDATCSDVAAGGQVLDNVDYVYPENGYHNDSLYRVMNDMVGWNGNTFQADTITDVNVVMVDKKNVTLAADDTVHMAFGVAISDVSIPDLQATIGILRYNANNACALCPIDATGDVNQNGSITSADIIYLVGYVFKGGAAPLPCAAAGDVNCNGSVTSADIIYLVGYVFKGGNPPCDVCTMIPGTWTCP